MPPRVSQVRWKCKQCGKTRWLKPHLSKRKQYCSRTCHYAAMRVENPVRGVPSQVKPSHMIVCAHCGQTCASTYRARKYCSRPCQVSAVHAARQRVDLKPRPCEVCGTEFRPRPGSAGRFCSRPCTYAGSRGSKSPNWRGGRIVTADGYVKVRAPEHPKADHFGYFWEHRLVMEQKLGRPLTPRETVHHINNDRADNRPENLQLRQGKHGTGSAHRCMDCGSTRIEAVKLADPATT